MKFENYLIEQINTHPSVEPQDIVKLCFQAAYGAEHLLNDVDAAKEYFDDEYATIKAEEIALYEMISEDVCRVNFAAWKAKGYPSDWLFRMFVASAAISDNGKEKFLNYLDIAEKFMQEEKAPFSYIDWCNYLEEYKRIGMPAVHHSSKYRESEKPSYRIINSRYIRLLPILEEVAKLNQEDKVCVIAIDGRAASGKSTMAEQLKSLLCGEVIHMDDFFLPVELRTEERLEMPGGNIHYERFIEEVLPFVSVPQDFSYRIFDCGKLNYNGEQIIKNTKIRIVEGSYSCHPLFGDYADITVFSDVGADEQIQRIYDRDGSEMTQMFGAKWIPLEEKYFDEYQIINSALVKV